MNFKLTSENVRDQYNTEHISTHTVQFTEYSKVCQLTLGANLNADSLILIFTELREHMKNNYNKTKRKFAISICTLALVVDFFYSTVFGN